MSIPAYPFPVEIVQPDGSRITVIKRGDEFFNYTVTLSGDAVVRKSDGFYYYATYSFDGIKVSDVRVGSTKSFGGGFGGVSPEVANHLRSQSALLRPSNLVTKGIGIGLNIQPKRGLVLLVEFADVHFTTANVRSSFQNLQNQEGYNKNNATGSVKDYFKANSRGQYDPTFDVYGPFTLPNNMKYYGENGTNSNDKRPGEMVLEACKLASSSGVDFSKYDEDSDGQVDMIYVYYAGYSEAEHGPADAIWPHKHSVANYMRTYNGKKLATYACSSELKGNSGSNMVGIGTFCHEFSHVVGLADIYDTDYETNGKYPDMAFSLMSSGSYLNNGNTPPYYNINEQEVAGWSRAKTLPNGEITLKNISTGDGYRLNTSTPGEYFLFEYRQNVGWDKYVLGNTPFSGLVVYHVDESSRVVDGQKASDLWANNKTNAYAIHPCFRVIPAEDAYTGVKPNTFFPTATVTAFSKNGHTMAKDWDGNNLKTSLTNIKRVENGVSFISDNPSNYHSFKGKVFSESGLGLPGVFVKLTPHVDAQAMTKSGVNMIYRSLYKADALDEITTSTNSKGEFFFNDLKGQKYDVSMALYGYIPMVETIEITSDSEQQFTLKRDAINIQKKISHSNSFHGYFRSNTDTGIANKFTAEHIAKLGAADIPLNVAFFYTMNANATGKLSIKINEQEVFTKSVKTVEGLNIVELPTGFTIPSGSSAEVLVVFSNGGTTMCIDQGPAVPRFGDLYLLPSGWKSLRADSGNDYNVCIGFWADKGTNELDDPMVSLLQVKQRDAKISLNTNDVNIERWEVAIGPDGNIQKHEYPANARNLSFIDLNPATKYNLSVTAVFGDKRKTVEKNFETQALTAPFVAIDMPTNIKANETFVPALKNMPQRAKTVAWKLNGSDVSPNGFNFTKYGEHELRAEIVWEDGTDEVVVKKFTLIQPE